ncbi:hypothetical protein EKG38_06110 [Shewanella canadensis]|uniref:Uncharacterized protein n=1 Tax=Shewanella canadensis TaxID=271096 RepID=A0A3S0KCI4_9GAMM|nr:hypothetical protein [Shewanella canadensis]RTR40287.1 hypothetical protein EKG38_06110 [Shewanella canadensis]
MSQQASTNNQVTQNYIGKSILHGAENFTLSELSTTVTKVFSTDGAENEELIHAGKLAVEAGGLMRNAIWAAARTEQPKKSGLSQGEYFSKYFGLEAYQATKEITRAKVQSLLTPLTSAPALNDSCLDELGKINKEFGKELMCDIYKKCCLRISNENENDLRLTKKLIQTILQTALKLSTVTSSKDHQNSVQPETSTAESSQSETTSCSNQEKQDQPESSQSETTSCSNQEKQDQPESSQSETTSCSNQEKQDQPESSQSETTSCSNQEKQDQPESSQSETTSCSNQEKQDQPESSQSIGLKSALQKEQEKIATPIQPRTPKLPSFRKKAQNKKSKKKAISALHTKRTPFNSINKLDYEQITNQIGEQTFLIEQKFADAKGNLHKTEQLLADLLINRADALLTCNRFAYLLKKFQPNARKTTKQATELTIYLETASCLRAEFIDEIKNLIVL